MYARDLTGTHVEMRCLRELVQHKLPRLAAHMDALGCDMSILATGGWVGRWVAGWVGAGSGGQACMRAGKHAGRQAGCWLGHGAACWREEAVVSGEHLVAPLAAHCLPPCLLFPPLPALQTGSCASSAPACPWRLLPGCGMP